MTTTAHEVEETSMEAPAAPKPELRVADRCDHGRCGAQAFVISEHDGSQLYWCGHHAQALDEFVGPFIVLDARNTINKAPSPSV